MKFDQSIGAVRNDIIKTAQELISYNSIKEAPVEGGPFGASIKACLERTLELCEEMGFRTKNFDGYAGHAEYGEGEDIVGVLVHLDIVPAGLDWSCDPFGGEIVDGRLYGRGAIDDKGPAAAAIYALKALKDCSVTFKKRVRLIFGCDEESGWACMDHYFKHAEMPSCGFSPDADFPIINSEMGILVFNLEKKFGVPNESSCGGLKIKSIKGGNRVNMVPDLCECELEQVKDFTERIEKTASYMNEKLGHKIEMKFEDNKCFVAAHGVSAHGSTPAAGVNAVSQMLEFLSKLPLCVSEQTDYISFLSTYIGKETDGHSLGINLEDEISGKLVFNLGIIEMNDQIGNVKINIRYPVTKTKDEVYDKIRAKAAENGITFVEGASKEPLYVPADNFLVQTLKKVYEEVTGAEAKLISIGGGTYARAIKNAVAFGPLFPGKPELAHQKDEYIEVDDLIKSAELYAAALYHLVK